MSDTGRIDLVAAPVEAMTSGRYSASPASKKQRQVINALQSLSASDVQLVHLPAGVQHVPGTSDGRIG